ncbi:MAG: GGDEF domain-containing phosphodiesterase [Ruminococcus sp.]|nr:GGDEF domain-containing phosphodiesterase [Ruminococcus sp.]
MEKEKQIRYYELLEQLIAVTRDSDNFSLDKVYKPLSELCRLFRVSKGVTEFYKSANHEKSGRGEVFVCYDSGEDGSEVLGRRIVDESMAVSKCRVYMADGAEPMTDEEREKVDLVMKIVLSFISNSRLRKIVERLTFYDDNGYRNMRSFMRCLEQLNEKKQLGTHTAIYFNLRHFSQVNQEIGRNNGDIVLRNYYTMLEEVIGDDGIICRAGGDNFVAVFDDGLLIDVLEILKGVPVPYGSGSSDRVTVSASTGVFRIPDGFVYEDVGDIMDKIATTSRAAKLNPSDNIVFFDGKTEEGRERLANFRKLLPLALENGEFKVYYQPKTDIQSEEVIGAEALCRWEHEGAVIMPSDFIPILEQSSDICKLDFYMLEQVCRDIRRRLDEGKRVVRVSVNLSRKNMMDADLPEHVIDVVDKFRVPHDLIEIELTESTTDVEFKEIKRVVSELQQEGISTSVDDFGLGQSSLNLIREIPWNVLKIDRSLLPIDEENPHSTRSIMFKYIVAMAKELGLECIAEGVETENQVRMLRDNSCSVAQGFYFDKPLPPEQFEAKLDK